MAEACCDGAERLPTDRKLSAHSTLSDTSSLPKTTSPPYRAGGASQPHCSRLTCSPWMDHAPFKAAVVSSTANQLPGCRDQRPPPPTPTQWPHGHGHGQRHKAMPHGRRATPRARSSTSRLAPQGSLSSRPHRRLHWRRLGSSCWWWGVRASPSKLGSALFRPPTPPGAM